MSEKVIVAVDNRGISESVLAWLTERERSSLGLEIEVVTVAELGWVPPGTAEVDYRDAYEQALWQSERSISAALSDVGVSRTMTWGAPAEQLIAASARADLMVLGSDRPRAIAGIMTGTVSLRVAAHSDCPTVVVPADWGAATHRQLVIVGAALEPSDDVVFAFAASEAERSGGELRIIHALPFPHAFLAAEMIPTVTEDALRAIDGRALRLRVEELRTRYPELTISIRTPKERPAVALVDYGKDAALIVIGTHGRSFIGNLVLGSVCHNLLLNAPCPVAVVSNGKV